MENKKPMSFSVGEWVTWTSSAAGSTKTKTGRVVLVVASGYSPGEYDLTRFAKTHRMSGITAFALGRWGGQSYLVSVPGKGHGKPTLYWPRTTHLRKV